MKIRQLNIQPEAELVDYVNAIDQGIKAANAGQLVEHEDVVAWVRSWGQPNELPQPLPAKV